MRKTSGVRFYRVRVLILVFFSKILSKILFMEMPPAVSVAALISKSDKLSCVKLTYKNGYALPGGHVHTGETLGEAIECEVKEETDLKIDALRYFNSYKVGYGLYDVLNVCFLANAGGDLASSEEGRPKWMNAKLLIDKLVYKDNKVAVKEYLGLI